MLRELLESMTREKIIDLLVAYDQYIIAFFDDDEFNHMGRVPVYVAEFYDNEYQQILYPDA